MNNMIRIQPTRDRLRPFAVWATAQTPKVRTVGVSTFAVPAHLFVEAPESILIGALIEGRRYVSPEEDVAQGRPAPGEPLDADLPDTGARLLSCGLCYEENGEEVHPHPECPLGVDPTPHVAVSAPPTVDTSGSDRSDSNPNKAAAIGGGKPACDLCQREFTSTRGRDAHRRQVHPEA
ncbi:hypothetical protein ACFV1C_00020 [Streptomyces sp. NPDC059605]|uniref:hypothetical protein n=1 Tax=Streptomyces sp. NPDC059605 TaxID=3346882 RepID=UPI00367458F5